MKPHKKQMIQIVPIQTYILAVSVSKIFIV